jgi:hypothetical protein
VRSAGYFAGFDAGGADVQPLGRTGHDRMHALDVGVPAPIGLLLRPGDVAAESGPLAAYVAYRSHWNPLPKLKSIQISCPNLGNRKRVPDKVQHRPIAATCGLGWAGVSPARGAGAHAVGRL